MTHRPSDLNETRSDIEQQLLQRLFDADRPYLWNPDAPEADDYFAELDSLLDTHCDELVGSDAELAQQWQNLSARLEATMAQPGIQTEAAAVSLPEVLYQQFAGRIPKDLLQTIAQRAQEVFTAQQSLQDQLVQCAQSVLPDWQSDDLQVMARPLAFAMRDSESDKLEMALRSVRFAAWTELSGVEKARLSLAIARYALAQLDTPNASAGA
jgi:hypothetical protein